MRGRKIKSKRRYRWLAGLFCVSLFFSEVMSAGAVVSAQEPVPVSQDLMLQENDGGRQEADGKESSGNAEQAPGNGEGGDGPEQAPDGGEGSDGPEQAPAPGGEEGGDNAEQRPDDGKDTEEGEISTGGEGDASVSGNSPEEDSSVSDNTLSENTLEENMPRLLSAEDDIAGGSYGKVTWVIRANGELIVEGEGEFAAPAPKTESAGRAPWYEHREEIQSATVRLTGATDLSGMFADCFKMTRVDVSGFDTSNVTDMSGMFSHCTMLTRLDVSGFDTSRVTDMSEMFSECNNLAKLDLSGFNTSKVTDMSGMFSGCIGMANWMNQIEMDVSSFDTSNVTDMSRMFERCYALALDVSGFDTSKVTDMSEMFHGCFLPELNVSSFDTSKVTDMSGMFWGCSLPTLNLSGFDTSSVTDMSDMFRGCSLAALDVSGFDTSSVTDMSSMFSYCRALTALDLSSFNTSNVTDMGGMFTYCEALAALNVSGFDTSKVTNMGEMFGHCKALPKLDVSGFDTSNVTNMFIMFYGCENLAELDLRNFDTSSVTNMAGMFQNCENLVALDLSSFNTYMVSNMGFTFMGTVHGMFSGCKKLERLDVGSFHTGNVATMQELFNGCESLKELDLSSFDMGRIAEADRCKLFLQNCKKLEKIYTPRNVNVGVSLPKEKDSDVWRGIIDGEQKELTEMERGRSDSILLVKNKTQVQAEERIVAQKGWTLYDCGEELWLDGLRVTYYGADGSVRTLSAAEYMTNAMDIDMSIPGEKILVVTYEREGTKLTAEVKLRVIYGMTEENTTVSLPEPLEYAYTGQPIRPIPTVVCQISGAEVTLKEGTDYTLSYRNHIKVDASAPEVTVTGKGYYSGTLTKNFAIRKAASPAAEQILCYASDCDSAADRKLDLSGSFAGCGSKTGYHIVSVTEDDSIAGAVFARTPVDADISNNGTLTYSTNAGKPGDFATVKLGVGFANYEDAELTVKIVLLEERVAYTITYDTMGHGGSGWTESVKAGGLLQEPEPLAESGYLFTGWYADRRLERKWDFAADTVQEDATLYAGWLSDRSEGRLQMFIQDIEDMAYTGNALKPTVVVYDNNGETLLKAGKDYTVKYYNNVNAGGAAAAGAVAKAVNPGKKNETLIDIVPGRGTAGEGASGHNFTKDAPYIAITGKGNYTETIYKNFCIMPVGIGTADTAPAQGFMLKYTDQLVTNGKKEQKPFASIKYKKAMKAGVDFRLSLGAADALDAAGQAVPTGWKVDGSDVNKQNPAIPKGYSGTFLLTIVGQGNYTGEIRRTVFVNSGEKLIKNASITLGKDQKSRPYTGRAVTLTDFSVKAGKTVLSNGKDYTISYADNVAVGTASMTITGKNGYVGSKSITFKITGDKFTAGNITVKAYDKERPNDNDFKASMPYTGSAVVQNKVTLSTKAKQLVYGQHYTIGYKNNVKKGTATMIFTAKPESGYSGSFQKTFKITAQPLSGERLIFQDAVGEGGSSEIQAVYRKNGAVPSFTLINEAGVTLKPGTDYTVKCKNNAAVTTAQTPENKKPVMTITGKGSYTGKIVLPFKVVQESIDRAIAEGVVQTTCTPVLKKEGMGFKDFRFKLVEGKKTLALGETKDYTLDTADCTPEKMMAYAKALEEGNASGQPQLSVTVIGAGSYTGTTKVELGMYLYTAKLEKSSLYVVVHEGKGQNVYTGKQLTPQVEVYYGEAKAVSKAKQAEEQDGAVLTAGEYKLVKLTENDYTLDYGTNTVAGKNKGSVKVTGAGKYGGSVTVKFNIEKKAIYTDS